MSFCPQRSERVSLLSFHHGTSLSNLCLSAMVERQIIKTRPLPSPMEEDKTDRSPLDAQLVGFITGLLSHTSCPPFVSGYLQLVGERRHKPKDTNCAQPTSPRTGQAQMKEK